MKTLGSQVIRPHPHPRYEIFLYQGVSLHDTILASAPGDSISGKANICFKLKLKLKPLFVVECAPSLLPRYQARKIVDKRLVHASWP